MLRRLPRGVGALLALLCALAPGPSLAQGEAALAAWQDCAFRAAARTALRAGEPPGRVADRALQACAAEERRAGADITEVLGAERAALLIERERRAQRAKIEAWAARFRAGS